MNEPHENFRILREIFSGRLQLANVKKYSFLCYSLSVIHLLIMLRFLSLDYTILYVYNFFSVVLYLVLGTLVPRLENFFSIYLCAYFEIILHSTLASILAGWDWGFPTYTLALIPVSFYLAYSLPHFKRSMVMPVCFSVLDMALFLFVKSVCFYVQPIYYVHNTAENLTFSYCFNAAIAFIMLTIFSGFFSMDIRHNELGLEAQKAALEIASTHDPLTRLLNRRSMDEHLEKALSDALESNMHFTLALGDIDDFKRVNDTYGHNVGDEVLVHVSSIIFSNIADGGAVCRWGGEEILILIPETGENAYLQVEKIRRQIMDSQIKSKDEAIHITMTFGLSEYSTGSDIQKLISIADENLYKGKGNGKNQVVI